MKTFYFEIIVISHIAVWNNTERSAIPSIQFFYVTISCNYE